MVTVLDRKQASAAAAGCRQAGGLAGPAMISVDGVTIPRDEIARETQNHPASRPIEAWHAAARALVVRALLAQEARRLGIEPAPLVDGDGRRETDDEARIRMLVEREVVAAEPDEATCRRFYEANRAKFRSSDLYGVRHILIAAAPGDAAGRANARTRAATLIARLASAPGLFAALAEEFSACPSKACGGNLGQVSRGQTVPEFEAGLAALAQPGLAGAPIESRYGFHVVHLDHRMEGEALPFELARPRIAGWLGERARHTAIRRYIACLASRAEITGIDIEADPTLPAG